MWLPSGPLVAADRTLTGTSARTSVRDDTDSPRVIIHSRSAPETDGEHDVVDGAAVAPADRA